MWIMKPADRQELEDYRALGTVDEVKRRLSSPFPTTDDYAPLPFSDPAMASVEAYEDCWHDEREYSGLLEEDA